MNSLITVVSSVQRTVIVVAVIGAEKGTGMVSKQELPGWVFCGSCQDVFVCTLVCTKWF
jgi:hypothetical protein